MRYLFTLFLASAFSIFSFSQTVQSSSVFFDHDRSELTADAKTVLAGLTDAMLAAPDYELTLNAYTDNTGTNDYNQQLANARADAVRQYLAGQGMVTDKIMVSSWGEQRQRFGNDSEANRQKNRRVDLDLRIWSINSPEDFQKRLRHKTEQTYTINTSAEQTINTPSGGLVVIPPGSFVFEDGSEPVSPVTITIKEAFRPGDWIVNGLVTTSNGQLLQSGGMMFVSAAAGGRELQLAEGAELTIALPAAKDVDTDMQLFYGRHNNDDNVIGNWIQASENARFRQTMINTNPVYTLTPELLAQLHRFKVPIPNKPKDLHFPALVKPVKPVAPPKPWAVIPPDWNKVAKLYSADGNPKGRDLRNAKQHFEKKQQQYSVDSTKYSAEILLYQKKYTKYEAQLAGYNEEYDAWRNTVKKRLDLVKSYKEQKQVYEYATVLASLLKTCGKTKPVRYQLLNEMFKDRTKKILSGRNFKKNYIAMFNPDAPVYTNIFGAESIQKDKELRNMIRRNNNRICNFELPEDSVSDKIKQLHVMCGLKALSDSLYTAHLAIENLHSDKKQQKIMMASYVTEITQLGWINADKFSKDTSPRIELTFNAKDAFAMYAYFPNLNSMLMLDKDEENSIFIVDGVPQGQPFRLITLKTDQGQLWLNQQQLIAGKTTNVTFDYTACSMQSFRKELNNLF